MRVVAAGGRWKQSDLWHVLKAEPIITNMSYERKTLAFVDFYASFQHIFMHAQVDRLSFSIYLTKCTRLYTRMWALIYSFHLRIWSHLEPFGAILVSVHGTHSLYLTCP